MAGAREWLTQAHVGVNPPIWILGGLVTEKLSVPTGTPWIRALAQDYAES